MADKKTDAMRGLLGHGLNRRSFLKSVAVAGAAAGTASQFPMPAIAQDKSVVRLQSFGGAFEEILRGTVIPQFESEHPFKVEFTVEDDTTLLPKLRASRGTAPYDVVTVDNSIAIVGNSLDLWAPDQSANLSNIADVYESCKPPTTANYGSIIYEYTLIHHNERFPSPKSWKDLWAADIVVGVPHVTQSYGLTFLYLAAMLHGGDENNLDPGFEAIKKLKKYKIYKNVSEGMNLLQQNEIDGALFYGHRSQQIIDFGLNYSKTTPVEGVWGQHTGSQIPKNTGNLEGAVAWVNNCLSVPYQTAFAPKLYSPTNSKVELPPELAAKHVMGAERVNAIREINWQAILPQRDALIERWTREIG